MRIICLFGVCLFLCWSASAYAQNGNVQGRVTDQTTGNPINGVSVFIEGTRDATATNENGDYSILGQTGKKIIFTHVNYQEGSLKIGTSSVYNMELIPKGDTLGDVVVVGYGTQRRRDVTGSVASLSKDRLQQLPNSNLYQAIQGSVPGVFIATTSAGAEGSGMSVLIRGRKSITANTDPLIILDGIPFTGSISDINPNDIESVDILKDASAVAIYGSRGSNGVFIVTSKQGKKGVSITYDGFYSIQTLTNKPRLLTGPEFYDFKKNRKNSNNVITPQEQAVYDSGKWIDWYDLATQKGIRRQHSLAVSGGAEKINYYVGGTYLNVTGVSKNDDFKRYSLKPSLNIKVTPWLTFGSTSQLSFIDRSGLPVQFDDVSNTGSGANFFNPLTQPYDSSGSIAVYAYEDYTQAGNPLSNLLVLNTDNAYKVFTANNIKIDFPFLQGLSYKLNTGLEYDNIARKTYYGRNVADGLELKGRAVNYNSISRSFTVENILNYARQLKKHNLDVVLLYSSQSEDFDRDQLIGTGFPNDVLTNYQMNSASLLVPAISNTKSNLISQMIRLNYSFDSRYLLTLTTRRDGYSAFGEGKKYGIFPSVAVAWNIASEPFIANSDLFDLLKLRASYGENGNQAVSPYSSQATLTSAPYLSGGVVYPGYIPDRLGNENLGWESTTSATIGLDWGILKNRIRGSIDYYQSKTHDLLLRRIISSVHGSESIVQNIGKTANQGIEIGITSTNIETDNFKWTSNVNFSFNKNEILELYGTKTDDIVNRWFIGQPIRVYYGLEYDGIFRTAEEVAASAQKDAQPGWVKVKDINGDSIINTASDRVLLGQLDPKYIWGFSNNLSYRNLALSVFIHGVGGNQKANPFLSDNVFGDIRRNTTKKDWWSESNPSGTHFANDQNANKLSVYPYENGSFVRLKDISLSYTFPNQIIQKAKLTNLKIYVTARNLATFTKYQGLDPELDNQFGLPLQKEFLFGLTLTL